MIGTGVKTRYISGVVRDKDVGIRGLPSGTEEFMPLGLGETQLHYPHSIIVSILRIPVKTSSCASTVAVVKLD